MKKQTKKFETKEIKKSKYMNDDVKRVISFFIVLILVALFILLLFFINGKYVTKDQFQNEDETVEVNVDEDLITLDDTLKMKDDEYYVLAYSEKETSKSSILASLRVNYSKDLYYANLDNISNKSHYDLEKAENVKVTNIKELNLIQATLIKVKKGKIISYTTDMDEIIKKLSEK